jgi:hypothetical protein
MQALIYIKHTLILFSRYIKTLQMAAVLYTIWSAVHIFTVIALDAGGQYGSGLYLQIEDPGR